MLQTVPTTKYVTDGAAPYASDSTKCQTSIIQEGASPAPSASFTQTRNDYFDVLMAELSGAAWKCLCYLIRHTTGYQRTQVRLSIAEFTHGLQRRDGTRLDKGTGLSRSAVFNALQELTAANVIATDAEDRARTQVRTYSVQRPEHWTLDALTPAVSDEQTSVKNGLVSPRARTDIKSGLVDNETSPKNTLVEPQTSPKNGHLRNKERERKTEKETTATTPKRRAVDTAHSSPHETPEAPVAPPVATPPTKAKRERKLPTDEQQYRAELLDAIKHLRGGEVPPVHGREWKAAGWFYRQPAGAIPCTQVVACYRVEMHRPRWDTAYLSLDDLTRVWGAWHKNPANFERGIERARAAADGQYDAARVAVARASPSAREPTPMRRASEVAPAGWGP